MRRPRLVRPLFVLAVCVAPMAGAHIWYVVKGVHFKGGNVDFGNPPPRYQIHWSGLGYGGEWRPGTEYLWFPDCRRAWLDGKERNWEDEDQVRKRWETSFAAAVDKERRGRYREAISDYAKLAKAPFERGDFLRVRGEVLPIAVGAPNTKGLDAYLKGTRPGGTLGPLSASPGRYAKQLEPYVLYDGAMTAYEMRDYSLAAIRFERLARKHPRTPRAEAALIMVPRSLLNSDRSLPKGARLLADCRRADSALRSLLSQFPKTRFESNAHCWLGRIDYLLGRTELALAHYRRALEEAEHPEDRRVAIDSMAICESDLGRRERLALAYVKRFQLAGAEHRLLSQKLLADTLGTFDVAAADRFVKLLLSDGGAFPAYFDMRMYLAEPTKSRRRNLLSLAEAWSKRHPLSPDAAYMRSRIAESHYLDGRYSLAASSARRALASRNKSDDAAALATYVLGSCARRAARTAEAARHYERLLARYMRSYLAAGAREALALAHERLGRLDKALEAYMLLGYEYDVAYLLDAKMTPGQLARFINSRPRHPNRKLLTFSLGVRYLRERNWRQAERWLSKLSRKERRGFAGVDVPPKRRGDAFDPSYLAYDDAESLRDPLETARDLRRLEARVRVAKGADARAAAMLAMAKFYYAGRNLALYNATLWHGDRALVVGASWNHGAADKSDIEALRRHHYEHECMAHSLQIAQHLLKRHPKSRSAPEAAMLGIKSAKRLASLNPWWRDEEQRARLRQEALRLCKFLASVHPSHPLTALATKMSLDLRAEQTRAKADALAAAKYRQDSPGF